MNRIGKKILGWIKIVGLAFTIISGSAFMATGCGLIYHANKREESLKQAQNTNAELQSIKIEKNIGLGLATAGAFIGLGKFYLTFGTYRLPGIGPTSKKLTSKIKKVYENDIKQQ